MWTLPTCAWTRTATQNLSVNVDAAYVRVDADSDTWHGAEESQYKDNYRFSVLFTYSF